MSLTLGISLIALCVMLEAFFSGTELAMVSANRLRLQAQAEAGDRGSQRALDLLRREDVFLATCLIGTNLCTVTGSTITAWLLWEHGITSAAAVTLVFTPVTMIFGEALPKTVLQHHANTLVPWLAGPLRLASLLFTPLLWVATGWSRAISRIASGDGSGLVTREALIDLIEEERGDAMDPDERRLIRGVLSLSGIRVFQCMTPLVRVVAVNETASTAATAETAVRTRHSRLPVFRHRIDHIVGVIHQADLLFVDDDRAPVGRLMQPIVFVPERKSADSLFREMRESGNHFAVVVDEYGGCVGIVTLEDLLEEVVGDIEDEREVVRPAIVAEPDGSFLVPGNTDIEDVEEATGWTLPQGDYETLAGFILDELGRIPHIGEEVEHSDLRITVTEATDRCVLRLQIQQINP